jgi:hypothetical protein
MNSPLEIREVRLRGLHGRGIAGQAGIQPERLKSPQRLRKASQTARGFNGSEAAGVHV